MKRRSAEAVKLDHPGFDYVGNISRLPPTTQRFAKSGLEFIGARWERMRASRRFRDGRFHNTAVVREELKGQSLPLFGELLFGRNERVPRTPLPMESPLLTWATKPVTGLRVTWLGHSTMLLELGGVRVLTDPVFGLRASPFGFAGPKRFHPPPVSISQLPDLDAVLISHDHYDHLCYPSVLELARRGVRFITSLGVGARLASWGIPETHIAELDWFEDYTLPGTGLTFTATPAQHFSGRTLRDRNVTLWSSWVLRDDKRKVFFSGDTGLTEEFRHVGLKYGPFDLVMMEVGAFHPSWGDIHLGPANALKAHAMLGGGPFLPVHWGTFNLALHSWDEPAETLLRLAAGLNSPVFTPQLGGTFEPQLEPTTRPWWRLG